MATEIIDLTDSPPSYQDIGGQELVLETSTSGSSNSNQKQKNDKKKMRRKKRKPNSADNGASTPVKGSSVEDGEPEDVVTDASQRASNTENITSSVVGAPMLALTRSSILANTVGPNAPFFIDLNPSPLPPLPEVTISSTLAEESAPKLFLPPHVSVFGEVPVEILLPSNGDSEREDYIDYLDYDDTQEGLVRYFNEPDDDTSKKPSRIVCKHCGEEGTHRTSACTVLICLTCGARNEHPTRSCPISKTCFTCGMKGHINATCPNKNNRRLSAGGRYDDCDRCGSLLHKTNECPTLWRLYEYLTDEEKQYTVSLREEKKNLCLGEGGEGYIAGDEWCYNCGNLGHWGDDCTYLPHKPDLPREPSAFSIHNISSGPFFDFASDLKLTATTRSRDFEQSNTYLADGMPQNVGKEGKRKIIAALGIRAKEQELADDPDDWFGNPDVAHNRSQGNRKRTGKITFGEHFRTASQFPPKAPSLLDRIERSPPRTSGRSLGARLSTEKPIHLTHSSRRRDHRSGHPDSGPRYRGGYAR